MNSDISPLYKGGLRGVVTVRVSDNGVYTVAFTRGTKGGSDCMSCVEKSAEATQGKLRGEARYSPAGCQDFFGDEGAEPNRLIKLGLI
jgi:hypothetical protein